MFDLAETALCFAGTTLEVVFLEWKEKYRDPELGSFDRQTAWWPKGCIEGERLLRNYVCENMGHFIVLLSISANYCTPRIGSEEAEVGQFVWKLGGRNG